MHNWKFVLTPSFLVLPGAPLNKGDHWVPWLSNSFLTPLFYSNFLQPEEKGDIQASHYNANQKKTHLVVNEKHFPSDLVFIENRDGHKKKKKKINPTYSCALWDILFCCK